MLKNGIKINFELTKDDIRVDVAAGALGYVVNFSIDLKRWKVKFQKKSYSVMACVGPFMLRITSLEKIGQFINNVLKENEDKLHSEM